MAYSIWNLISTLSQLFSLPCLNPTSPRSTLLPNLSQPYSQPWSSLLYSTMSQPYCLHCLNPSFYTVSALPSTLSQLSFFQLILARPNFLLCRTSVSQRPAYWRGTVGAGGLTIWYNDVLKYDVHVTKCTPSLRTPCSTKEQGERGQCVLVGK
jgi:hypothetical protein